MVLPRRQQEGRRLDTCEVDRDSSKTDPSGNGKPVLVIHGTQIEALHCSRHARGVGVPIEEVERNRLLSKKIVAYNKTPYQIVGAQHIEGQGHIVRLKISATLHALLEYCQLFFINKYRHVAYISKIDESDKVGRCLDPIIVLRRQISKRGGQKRASKAIADSVHLALAGRNPNYVQCGKWALAHVILEAFMSETLVWIDPRNHEYRMALIHSPSDERSLRP